MRRTVLIILGIGFVLGLLVLLASESGRARQVDDCVSRLQVAVQEKSGASDLELIVKGSALIDILNEMSSAEIAYARPKDANWARVGLVMKQSGDVSPDEKDKNVILGLLLDLQRLPECQFVRDYDKGPFGAHGRDGQLTKGSTNTSSVTQ